MWCEHKQFTMDLKTQQQKKNLVEIFKEYEERCIEKWSERARARQFGVAPIGWSEAVSMAVQGVYYVSMQCNAMNVADKEFQKQWPTNFVFGYSISIHIDAAPLGHQWFMTKRCCMSVTRPMLISFSRSAERNTKLSAHHQMQCHTTAHWHHHKINAQSRPNN